VDASSIAKWVLVRVKDHLLRFIALHDQLTVTRVDEKWLREIESRDNLFPGVDWNYWQ
jgi:1,4-alpha-glucan branching enzyme